MRQRSLRLFRRMVVYASLALGAGWTFVAATPGHAQVIDLDVQPLDLSLLTLDPDLLTALDVALDPAAAALINCLPTACVTYVEALAAQSVYSQQFAATALTSATMQTTQQVMEFALSSTLLNAAVSAFGSAAAMRSITPTLATFGISGVSHTSHDGFLATAGGTRIGRTPEFDSLDVGGTLGMRFDASKALSLPKDTLTLGAFGNYTNSDIDLEFAPLLRALGFRHTGDASLDSGSAGGYALLTDGRFYGLGLASGQFGDASVRNVLSDTHANFDTSGFASSLAGGVVLPAWPSSKVDLRAGLNYFDIRTDRHTDSAGLTFGEGQVEAFSGALSARLFSTFVYRRTVVRPFVQAGVDHRFDYNNDIRVEGLNFTFEEDPTTVFGRLGMDFEVDQYLQAYLSVRGDHNEDFDTIAGQVGLTFKLN